MRQNLQILSTESSKVNDKFKFSDEKLILRFQEGDINAYNELVKRYKDRLFNFVLRYFNNAEQAEDVVQDTLKMGFKSENNHPKGKNSQSEVDGNESVV